MFFETVTSPRRDKDHEENETTIEPFDQPDQESTVSVGIDNPADPFEHPDQQNTTSTIANPEEPIPIPGLDYEVDLDYYLPLYRAAISGDWERVWKFIKRDPKALTAEISMLSMTALHVAASAGCSKFVTKLVEQMPVEALAMQDMDGLTDLHYAAISGITKAAKPMVEKNHEPPAGPGAAHLIAGISWTGFHDVALHLIQRYPDGNPSEQNGRCVISISRSPHKIVSWTAMIAGYVQNGFFGKGLVVFQEMVASGTQPNAVTHLRS
ncbi:hypothetical protein L1049_022695 [Liquidambar formosana]|uniref:Uncharacterized protein n=1 Tax=Liquidambar formosana TaxID=63359 RepID=A0AAP0RCU9_LIQFO